MIKLENLTKIFESREGRTVAADNVNMHVDKGEICVLLGPSGCGKTTTLKMINRLITPTSGKIYINGQDTTEHDTITLRRNIGYVIQQTGLFPNMTVAQNIAVVPRLLGWSRDRIATRTHELLEMMALDPDTFATRYPNELSGGQQQRIGVARALAADPPVLLMDEPFGAIDPINRATIQDEFLKMQEKLGKTVLFVSHDINEAVKMGSKIALFRDGRLEQFDTPDRILAQPANDFIADFVGQDRTLKRLPLTQVSQAMNPGALALQPSMGVEKARELLLHAGLPSAAVINSGGRLMGIVHHDRMQGNGTLTGWEPPQAMARPTDDLRTALSLMLDNQQTWLPCVDDDGHYQGAITLQDISNFLGAAGNTHGTLARS
ncbi:MAG TPA: ABC transporter ATP-binding protein [Burkholderiaceae bacterium]|nr:ABC transporter ATP-binding protein [Burkholderiaceae bacterium]